MKVFAEYQELANGENYRQKTLLQFGDSTKLIGSAVLINPGMAKPVGKPNHEMIKEFYSNTHSLAIKDFTVWKAFSVDPTMLQLEKIFNGWYIGLEKELNGIIQLFNCFYYKDQNLDRALVSFNSNSPYIFNEHLLLADKPVYFGWGNTGKNSGLREVACRYPKN